MAATHNTKEVVATVTLTNSIKDITKNEWDICAGVDNPFLSYDFMSSLEDSGSVGPETGSVSYTHLTLPTTPYV